ncbi:beta strand repeat-containing protein, partial [Tritonibacter mobilis]|uniref:beta strand repeat-containing protein n=2 Tax=Tritonibacter mobilis TaxID=379347 RepID=UPI000ADA8D67
MRILLLGTTAIYAGLTAQPLGSQTWTNGDGSALWGDAGNWDGGDVPDDASSGVVFDDAGVDSAVGLADTGGTQDTFTVNSLDIQTGTQLSGGTLVLDGVDPAVNVAATATGSAFASDMSLRLRANAVFTMLADFVSEATITAEGDQLLEVNAGAGTTTRLAGALEETGGALGVEVSGGGTVVMEAENTYTGATEVTSGTLSVTGAGTLASTDVNVASGGTLTTDGGALAAGTELGNAGTVTLGGSETIARLNGAGTTEVTSGTLTLTSGLSTVGGEISGAGGLTVNGATADVTLTAENTYTGATDVTSGTLSVTGSGTLASTDVSVEENGTLTTDGGALDSGTELENAGEATLGGSETIARLNGSGTTAVTSGTLTLTSGESEVDGAISGAGGLTVNDTGQAEDAAVTLTAENTYTGATDVTSGTLSVTGSGTLASTDVNVDSGGTLTTDGGALTAGTELENAGTVTLGGSETIARLNGSGTTAVTSGTLTLTSGESEVDGAISGAGGLTVNDTGQAEDAAVTLTAENTYTGATDVTSGTLSVTGSGTLASTDVNVDSGGTLTTDGGALTAGTELENAGTVTLGGSETIARLNGAGTTAVTSGTLTLTSGESEVDGVVSGAGGLTVNDTGQAEDAAVTLTAENTYTGATEVTSGTLSVTGSIASSAVTVGVDGKLGFDSATQSTIGALDNASAAADKGVNLAANTRVTVSTTAGSGELKNSGTISLGDGATLEA